MGRDRELDLLRAALAEARAGAGRYAELSGPPGIGKTQLVEALRAEAAGLTVLLATCEPHGGAGPYGAWRELLLPLIGAEWDDPAAVVVARLRAAVAERAHDLEPWLPLLAATLGVELPDTPAVAALAPAFRADRLHDAVVRFLAASLPDATVLVIEHAHDMDAASAALLGAVLEALPAQPWLIAAHPPRRALGRRARARARADRAAARAARARGGAGARPPADRGHAAAAAGARARRRAGRGQPAVPARPARRRRGRRRRADRDAWRRPRPRGSTGSTRATGRWSATPRCSA